MCLIIAHPGDSSATYPLAAYCGTIPVLVEGDRMDKRFWAIIGILVLAFVGILVAGNRGEEGAVSGATNHTLGSSTSKVTLMEYGDFQCSACGSFHPVFKQVKEKYADRVKFQFRHLPLTSTHPNAFAASRAAEAAGKQGKFWEMHDLLFESLDPTSATGWAASKDPLTEYFAVYAKQLKLNESQFKTDFASSAVNKSINADMSAFAATGAKMSTPTFFLNGKLVESSTLLDAQGAPNLDAFSKVLDAALAETK